MLIPLLTDCSKLFDINLLLSVSIMQMLNLNESSQNKASNSSSSGAAPKEPIWKILIYDRVGMDVLTPLFTVQELRQNGITLHM